MIDTSLIILAIIVFPILLLFIYAQLQKLKRQKQTNSISPKQKHRLQTALQQYADEIAGQTDLSFEEKRSKLFVQYHKIRGQIKTFSLNSETNQIVVESIFGVIEIDFNTY